MAQQIWRFSGVYGGYNQIVPSSNLGAAFDLKRSERDLFMIWRIFTLRKILECLAQNLSHLRRVVGSALKGSRGACACPP